MSQGSKKLETIESMGVTVHTEPHETVTIDHGETFTMANGGKARFEKAIKDTEAPAGVHMVFSERVKDDSGQLRDTEFKLTPDKVTIDAVHTSRDTSTLEKKEIKSDKLIFSGKNTAGQKEEATWDYSVFGNALPKDTEEAKAKKELLKITDLKLGTAVRKIPGDEPLYEVTNTQKNGDKIISYVSEKDGSIPDTILSRYENRTLDSLTFTNFLQGKKITVPVGAIVFDQKEHALTIKKIEIRDGNRFVTFSKKGTSIRGKLLETNGTADGNFLVIELPDKQKVTYTIDTTDIQSSMEHFDKKNIQEKEDSPLKVGDRIFRQESGSSSYITVTAIDQANDTFSFTIDKIIKHQKNLSKGSPIDITPSSLKNGKAKLSDFIKERDSGKAGIILEDTNEAIETVETAEASVENNSTHPTAEKDVVAVEEIKNPEEAKLSFLRKEIKKYESSTELGAQSALIALRAAESKLLEEIAQNKEEELLAGTRKRDELRLTLDTRVEEILSNKIELGEQSLSAQRELENNIKSSILSAEKMRLEVEEMLVQATKDGDERKKDYLASSLLQQKEFIRARSEELEDIQKKIAIAETTLAEDKTKHEETKNRIVELRKILGITEGENNSVSTTTEISPKKEQAPVEINEKTEQVKTETPEPEQELPQTLGNLAYGIRKFGDPLPEAPIEQPKTPEELLDEARASYIKTYHEFMEKRREQNNTLSGFMKKIGRVVTFRLDKINYADVPELGEKLQQAEEAYGKAKQEYANDYLNKKKVELLKTITSAPGTPEYKQELDALLYPLNIERANAFKEAYINEFEKINQLKVEGLPTKKRNILMKALDGYRKLSPAKRIALITLIAAGSAGAGALTMGAGAATAAAAGLTAGKMRLFATGIGTGAGLATKGMFNLKDKITGNTPENRRIASEHLLLNDVMLGKFEGVLANAEARYKEIIEKETRENRKRALLRGIAVAGTSFSAAHWLAPALLSPDNTTIEPNPKPEVTPPKIEPTPEITKEAFVRFNQGDGAIRAFGNLKKELALQYTGVAPEKIPLPVKEILAGDPEKLSMKFGMYTPGNDSESALLHEGGRMGIDGKGNLYYQDAGETTPHILQSNTVTQPGQWQGKMFDSDQSGDVRGPEMVTTTTITGQEVPATPENGTHGTEELDSGIEISEPSIEENVSRVYEKFIDKSFAKLDSTGNVTLHGDQSPEWLRIKDMKAQMAFDTYARMNAPGTSAIVDPTMKPFLTELNTLRTTSGIEPLSNEPLSTYLKRAVEALVKNGI